MHFDWDRACKIIDHHHSPSLRFPTNYCPAIGAENSRWKDQDHFKACPSLAWSRRHHELWQYWCWDRDNWEEVPRWSQRLLPSHVPALAQRERSKTLYVGHAHWTTRGLWPRGTHGRHSIRTVSISKLNHTYVHTDLLLLQVKSIVTSLSDSYDSIVSNLCS